VSIRDFQLTLESLAENKIRVSLVDSPAGTAVIETAMPLSADDMARMIGVLDGTTRATRGDAAKAARAIGERLFTTIISGDIYTAYNVSRQKGDLRIRLNLDEAGPFADWPWELLRDPNGDYLALSPQTPIIRSPHVKTTRPLKNISMPLRALAMITNVADQEALDVDAEWRTINEGTGSVRARGLFKLDRADGGELNALQHSLQQEGDYQVFHFVGFGAFDAKGEAGGLAFVDGQTNQTELVSGDALARELSAEHGVRLMVMNACQTPRQKRKDPFHQVASDIVSGGVPAVVAMQVPMSDEASRLFAREFYRALAEGYSVEIAVTNGRRAISATTGSLEWAAPALYFSATGETAGILFPRRAPVGIRVSYGGLRDALLRPPVMFGIGVLALIIVLSALFIVSGGNLNPQPTRDGDIVIATLTPTPQGAQRNIDLVADSLRFLPPNPAPGQEVKIAMRFINRGASDTGPFNWGWWLDDPSQNSTPTVRGTVVNLSPGLSTSVIASFRFPWWGKYTTTAFVNFDSTVGESNIFNNFIRRELTTTNDAFLTDFTVLPSGGLIEAGAIKGDEFAAWGFTLKAEPTSACAAPQLSITVGNDVSQLVTSSSGQAPQPDPCLGVPVSFTLKPVAPDPVPVSMEVDFTSTAAGEYALEVFGADGKSLKRETLQFSDVAVRQLEIALPAGSMGGKVVFSVPQGASVAIRRVSFAVPAQ